MAIGQWEPADQADMTLAVLNEWLTFARQADNSALARNLDDTRLKQGAGLMKRSAEDWQPAEGLDDQGLVDLIRFFTLAEMQIPGWDAGKTSPVIPLVKILKQRGNFDPELKRWIKANTDNRYLPNGAVL